MLHSIEALARNKKQFTKTIPSSSLKINKMMNIYRNLPIVEFECHMGSSSKFPKEMQKKSFPLILFTR